LPIKIVISDIRLVFGLDSVIKMSQKIHKIHLVMNFTRLQGNNTLRNYDEEIKKH